MGKVSQRSPLSKKYSDIDSNEILFCFVKQNIFLNKYGEKTEFTVKLFLS